MRRTTSKIVTRAIAGYPLILGILITSIAQAGVSYPEPDGGWRYTYDGTFAPGVVDPQFVEGTGPNGYGQPNNTEGLDGTWRHDQGDKWDGTAPGDPLSDPSVPSDPLGSLTGYQGTSPGGAGAFTEGSTTFIRVQDAGNPEKHGWVQGNFDDPTGPVQPINTNRRVAFGHDITQDYDPVTDPLPSELVLSDTGITISFRARIPNSGPLDDVYTWDDFNNEPEVIDWFQDAPGGHGMWMNNNRGMINVVQHNPNGIQFTNDTLVGFSLVNSTDITAFCDTSGGPLCTGNGSGGLIMNNLLGDTPSDLIDSLGAGTLNIIKIRDDELNDWNEFWITMEDNDGDPGNIRVSVYMNGSTIPQVLNVTLGANGNALYKNEDKPFLEFGLSNNDEFGAFDMDFLSYQLGVIEPVPEPTTLLLAMLGLASACFLRRRC